MTSKLNNQSDIYSVVEHTTGIRKRLWGWFWRCRRRRNGRRRFRL